jgi:hypothetical protein
MEEGMAEVARQLASVQADLASALAEHDQTLAECAATQERLTQAHTELATLQQGRWGTQAAGGHSSQETDTCKCWMKLLSDACLGG